MSRQQEWASRAFEAIGAVKARKDEGFESKYRTHALKYPALLIQSGLAQSLAFMKSRDSVGEKFVADLSEALGMGKESLLTRSRTAGLDEYTRLSALTLGAATWFRRFASELKEPKGGDE